jgi:hypothetical protein
MKDIDFRKMNRFRAPSDHSPEVKKMVPDHVVEVTEKVERVPEVRKTIEIPTKCSVDTYDCDIITEYSQQAFSRTGDRLIEVGKLFGVSELLEVGDSFNTYNKAVYSNENGPQYLMSFPHVQEMSPSERKLYAPYYDPTNRTNA